MNLKARYLYLIGAFLVFFQSCTLIRPASDSKSVLELDREKNVAVFVNAGNAKNEFAILAEISDVLANSLRKLNFRIFKLHAGDSDDLRESLKIALSELGPKGTLVWAYLGHGGAKGELCPKPESKSTYQLLDWKRDLLALVPQDKSISGLLVLTEQCYGGQWIEFAKNEVVEFEKDKSNSLLSKISKIALMSGSDFNQKNSMIIDYTNPNNIVRFSFLKTLGHELEKYSPNGPSDKKDPSKESLKDLWQRVSETHISQLNPVNDVPLRPQIFVWPQKEFEKPLFDRAIDRFYNGKEKGQHIRFSWNPLRNLFIMPCVEKYLAWRYEKTALLMQIDMWKRRADFAILDPEKQNVFLADIKTCGAKNIEVLAEIGHSGL